MYLRTMSTAAGQALEITSGESVALRSLEMWALTLWAPWAVSLTPAKPSRFSAPASRSIETPLKYPAKLGATDAYTFSPDSRSRLRRGRSMRTFLACAGQTFTHSSHATHASGMTDALPPRTRIALTGQCRTHL